MRITKKETQALVIDIQERLFPHMQNRLELLEKVPRLIEGLKILQIPVLVTEQYPKGLGRTVGEISSVTAGCDYFEKISFSCFDDENIKEAIQSTNNKNILICGIESHVCVLQTVIDSVANGFKPVVVEDCVSSRTANDKVIAMARMQQEGALVTTLESLLLEIQRVAGTYDFKQIAKLIK
ncbi:MAG: hydrolase [Desulfofustis sp.]|nr:hydrolase [Desulfofustis sp.]